jgi:formamidopyrimidine-DNA glycosylase
MPELPEVETLKLGLKKYLVGHKIEDVEIFVPKIFQGEVKNIIGAKVTGVKRVGKGLIIELNNDSDLVVHLKMTGQLVFQDQSTQKFTLSKKIGGETLPSKYSHVIFTLDKGAKLYFNDLRRFGYIKVIKKQDVKELPFFKEMGPEPFENPDFGQKTLSLNDFQSILEKSGLSIKVLLMDQKKIGGIGNIYANEALFKAGINPKRPAKQIAKEEAEKLYKAIFEVINKGLELGGSSDENFVNVLGQDGEYQQHFLAYGQEKKKCSVCGSIIEKIQLGGRGTYFCPKHQK